MTEQRTAADGRFFARWRERRRAKRQQALERRYFDQFIALSAGRRQGLDEGRHLTGALGDFAFAERRGPSRCRARASRTG